MFLSEKSELRRSKLQLTKTLDDVKQRVTKAGRPDQVILLMDLETSVMSQLNAIERTLNQIETEQFMIESQRSS